MDRDKFFAQLDQLTTKEIEERLSSWDKEKLLLLEEYLDQSRDKVAQSDQRSRAAADAAMWANTKATVALIIAVGAMMAAVLSAAVVVLGLQH